MDEGLGWFGILVLALLGFGTVSHIGSTNMGQHTGYVTAVEQDGIIWKTWKAYVKTDPQSSQEDAYCVTDPIVVSQLQDIEKTRASVTINYASPLLVWKWQCGGEGSIINSISDGTLPTMSNGVDLSDPKYRTSGATGGGAPTFSNGVDLSKFWKGNQPNAGGSVYQGIKLPN